MPCQNKCNVWCQVLTLYAFVDSGADCGATISLLGAVLYSRTTRRSTWSHNSSTVVTTVKQRYYYCVYQTLHLVARLQKTTTVQHLSAGSGPLQPHHDAKHLVTPGKLRYYLLCGPNGSRRGTATEDRCSQQRELTPQ